MHIYYCEFSRRMTMKNLKYDLLAVVGTMLVFMGPGAALSKGLHPGGNHKNPMTRPAIDMGQPTVYETASFGLG